MFYLAAYRIDEARTDRPRCRLTDNGVLFLYGTQGQQAIIDARAVLFVPPERREEHSNYEDALRVPYEYVRGGEATPCEAVCVWNGDHWRMDDEARPAFYAELFLR